MADAAKKIVLGDQDFQKLIRQKLQNVEPSLPTHEDMTPKAGSGEFNYKYVRSLVQNKQKTLKEAIAIYKHLKWYNLFPLIQDRYNLNYEEMLRLCLFVKFDEYRAGSIVYKKGDKSNNEVYFIISGEVSYSSRDLNYSRQKVNKKLNPISTQFSVQKPSVQAQPAEKKSKSVDLKSFVPSFKPAVRAPQNDDPNDMLLGSSSQPWLNKLITQGDLTPRSREQISTFMKRGRCEYFGESALIYNVDRSETVIAMTDCEFMVIDDLCIMKARSNKEELSDELKETLMRYLPGIQDISSKSHIERILLFFELVSFDKGAYIAKQGEPGNYIYIINEGEFQSYFKNETHVDLSQMFKSKSLEKHYRMKSSTEQIPIFISVPGNIIGEEIIFNESKTYHYSIKVLSATNSVFRIDKSRFVSRFPKEILKNIKKMYEFKQFNNQKMQKTKMKMINDDSDSFFLKSFEREIAQTAKNDRPTNLLNQMIRPKTTEALENFLKSPKAPRTARTAGGSSRVSPTRSPSRSDNRSPTRSQQGSPEKDHDDEYYRLKKKLDEAQKTTIFLKYASNEKCYSDLMSIRGSSFDNRDKNKADQFRFKFSKTVSKNQKVNEIMQMVAPISIQVIKPNKGIERGTQTARERIPPDCTQEEFLGMKLRQLSPTKDMDGINISNSLSLMPKYELNKSATIIRPRKPSSFFLANSPWNTTRHSESRSTLNSQDLSRFKSVSRIHSGALIPHTQSKQRIRRQSLRAELLNGVVRLA